MTAINERARTPRISQLPGPPPPRRRLRRHEDALIQAEVRRLARAVAVEAGRIKRLSDGFDANRLAAD